MSTSTILTGVGYVVGGYFGYPQLGAIIGGMVGGQIEANRMPDSKLDDLKAAKVSLGSPINLLFGHPRSGGNLAWVSDAIESGEEGGKGGGGPTTTNYVRHCLVVMSEDVCGPAARIWFGGKLAYNVLVTADDETIETSVEDGLIEEVIYYDGNEDQLPDPTYEAAIGVGFASAYRGRSTMMLKGIACGPSGQLPPITFECAGKAADIDVGKTKRILKEFARADYRGSPPEGASLAGTAIIAIDGDGIKTHFAGAGVVSDTFPTGANVFSPGSGNGDVAMAVFGVPHGTCIVAWAGSGITQRVNIEEPTDMLGSSELRFCTYKGDIVIGSTIPVGTGADIYIDASNNMGNIYLYRLNGEYLDTISIDSYLDAISSIAMNEARIWVLGSFGGNEIIASFDRQGSNEYVENLPTGPGEGVRIFVSYEGALCCANEAAEIYRFNFDEEVLDWELFAALNDAVDDNDVPVPLGTDVAHHMVRGASAYAVVTVTKLPDDPGELYSYYIDSRYGDLEEYRRLSYQQVVMENAMENGGSYLGDTRGAAFAYVTVDNQLRRSNHINNELISEAPWPLPDSLSRQFNVRQHNERAYNYPGDDGYPNPLIMEEDARTVTVYQYFRTLDPEEPEPFKYVDVYRKRMDVELYELTEPTLQEVVESLCLRADLPADRVDATDLASKKVHAMAVTQVSPTTSSLEMLMVVYKFYCTESSGKLVFKFYGDAPVRTIPFQEVGASFGEPPINPLPLQRGSELELPSMESARYANIDNDYQDGMESSDRLNASTQSASVSEYAIGLTPNEAKQLAVTNQQIRIAGLIRVGPVSVAPDNRDIEPGDTIVVTRQDGSTVQTFVQKLTFDRGLCTIEGVSEDTAAYTSDAVTANNYTNATVVRPPPETEFEILDIPLLSDETDTPHFHVVAKPERFPWSGYSFQRSPDNVSYAEIYQDNSIGVFGTCSTTLAQWTGANVVDNVSSVTVDVGLGQLSSITRTELITSRQNLAMVGNEMVQFQNAELITTGVYILSGFARYLGGTQWAGHGPNERFVLLRQSTLETVNLNLADYGILRYYKAVTLGRNPNTADSETFAPALVSMQPIAPANLRAIDLPNGDILLRWVRRTRYQSNSLRGIVPLGEASEAYTVQVYDGATLRRTISSTTTQATYTAAQQAADSVGSGSDLIFRVRQTGAVQGHPAELTLDV